MKCRVRSGLFVLPLFVGVVTGRAATFTVTTDSDAATNGICDAAGIADGCTLREAIEAANNASSNDVINFHVTAFSAPRKTIILNGTQLPDIVPNGNLGITAPPTGVIINGNNQSRIFKIAPSVNAIFTNLTISGGNSINAPLSTFGGGIYNEGTLLLEGCTLNDNSAESGGAVASVTDLSNAKLTLRNCTFSDNSATNFGGAVYNHIGLTIVESSTIVGNTASNQGGGIASWGDAATITKVSNSIVANNTNTDVDFVVAGINSYDSDGFNLVGDGNAAGAFIVVGDQVIGNASPGLGALTNNGGPTETRALLRGSLAIDTGNTSLTIDQRGIARPQRAADDIGAFEAEREPLVVTTTSDGTSDGVCDLVGVGDGCTLREAIDAANSDGVESAIVFSTSAFAAPRKNIILNGSELPGLLGDGNLTITAPPAGVVLNGNNASRVMSIDGAANVVLRGLTISGGNADSDEGGGIKNFGVLLLEGCTLSHNTALFGGAISTNTDLTGTTLTLRNCTISGNDATNRGGAIYNFDGLTVLESCTITGNTAAASEGSGVATYGDNATLTQVHNSIIAGNTGTDLDFVNGTTNSFVSQGFNLIGDGNATGDFNVGGDQITGNTPPGLAALGNNGGPTQTHAILARSTALNRGSTTLTTDQRGTNRPQGPNDDIGAFEAVLITIGDASITEGDSGTQIATFDVTLSSPVTQAVSISYTTTNGTAVATKDYTATSGTLTIPPGLTNGSIEVPVVGDLANETTEAFYVLLTSSVNATFTRARGTGTISDTDPVPSITIDDVRIGEGNSGQRTAVFRLQLSSPSGQVVRVTASTTNISATAGNDYVALAPTQIAFTVGNSFAYARVPINGDLLTELDETFRVSLSNPQNATLADSQALGTILNDDTAPALSINDVGIAEGNSGTKLLTFAVTLSKPSGQTITVNYASANGNATAGSDYAPTSGSLTFAPGQTSKPIAVVINGDRVMEPNELFYVLLSGNTNASIGRARGVGTITNDDGS